VEAEEKDVPEATKFVTDRRASHYWDEGGQLMAHYTSVLGLPEPAWDIYLVYGPSARWEGERPPPPDFWMHQLGSRTKPRVDGPYLEPDLLAQRAQALLKQR
jgi:hypothetical protein